VLNAKIIVGGRVTRRVWVWIEIYTHESLWVQVWIEFCLAGMDSLTIYPRTTHPIAIPSWIDTLVEFICFMRVDPHPPLPCVGLPTTLAVTLPTVAMHLLT
jgi:hypothetical protein